jgi:hypothetical protein
MFATLIVAVTITPEVIMPPITLNHLLCAGVYQLLLYVCVLGKLVPEGVGHHRYTDVVPFGSNRTFLSLLFCAGGRWFIKYFLTPLDVRGFRSSEVVLTALDEL